MNGSGAIDIGTSGELSGRLDLVLGSQSMVVARGVLHKNTAARKFGRLTKAVSAIA